MEGIKGGRRWRGVVREMEFWRVRVRVRVRKQFEEMGIEDGGLDCLCEYTWDRWMLGVLVMYRLLLFIVCC